MTHPSKFSSIRNEQTVKLTAPRALLRSLTPSGPAPSLEHNLVRPDDQVRLRFELVNGAIDRDTNTIVSLEPEEPIYYNIWFGPQHVVEQPIATGTTPPGESLASRIAGESRIVVEMPDGTPFTVATLLDLAAYTLQLDERAFGNADGTSKEEPTSAVTAIEVPASLILSPTPDEAFVADPGPITRGDITELWRARLAQVGSDGPVEPPTGAPAVRAIWSRSEDPDFDRPVDADDRDNLVNQTTGKDSPPIPIKQLWLSSQGAFLDADGAWAEGVLAAYRHRVVTGRDLHVEVVERGYLAPFGHPASITTLTERSFLADKNGESTASLTSEEFIAITTTTIGFPVEYMPSEGRALPFASVSASDPGSGPIGSRRVTMPNGSSINLEKARIVTRDGDDARISYVATDRSGQGGISFDLPVVFVADSEAYEPEAQVGGRRTVLEKLVRWYANEANSAFAEADLNGQAIAWAEQPADADRGSAGSVQTTNRIRFRLDRPNVVENDPATIEDALRDVSRPAFYPAVDRAWIVDLSSTTAFGGQPPETEVNVAQRYLDHGTSEANVDLGYLDLVEPIEITPTTDATGMISTNLLVETFGQGLGAGIDLSDGSWSPADALGSLGGLPTLLGNLSLAQLVGDINDLTDLSDQGLPKMEIDLIPGVDNTAPPVGVCVNFSWEPELKSFPTDAEKKTFIVTEDLDDQIPEAKGAFGDEKTHALLSLQTCTPGDETFEASLERFALQVPPGLPVVAILFERVRFRDVSGSSTVDTDIADWMFINQLGWLEPIKDLLLDTLGLGAPTFEGGIFIAFDLPIPGLTLGIVNIDGLKIGIGIDLPDTGASSVDFAMSSREDPFTITVFGVGGNGSFGLMVDASRVVYVEGSLAVTYELAVNVFIAAASLSVALGVFVIYEEGEVELGAYAELKGSISFIGIVKINGAVTVALIYNLTTKVLRGVAAVTGEVSSPFGKSSVTHDVEVEVALGDGTTGKRRGDAVALAAPDGANELSFRDRFTRPQWKDYCNAFAA
jgi:hypothetical protein